MGTSGVLVTDDVAGRIKDASIRKVAVSLDSTDPGIHDAFRGVSGAWERAVDGIRALRRAGVPVQIHTTVNGSDAGEIDRVIAFGKTLGVRDYQFFFLVPTGRGEALADVPPEAHEAAIGRILAHAREPGLSVRGVVRGPTGSGTGAVMPAATWCTPAAQTAISWLKTPAAPTSPERVR
ncbi:protein of unknown function [Methanoculleus bourgensis]|uniref:Radical SAM core domain-containing protein n=1 Tax=Methanoculleus bourgensis TaxID=83986 RepID=A0A0X3BQN2_9EURY|nr:protein of unknown function [Methanoculleus bourgensis]